jgi:lipid II:glycine glycyltransferase (peptidoglycan interpeptide bridge formation enzyme)
MIELNLVEWDQFVSQFPEHHILQSGIWGEFKQEFGWEVFRIQSSDGEFGAQILFRSVPFGLRLAYIPRGPVHRIKGPVHTSRFDSLWPEIDNLCRSKRTVFLKVEPDLIELTSSADREEISSKPIANYLLPLETLEDDPVGSIVPNGFSRGFQDIQPRRTLIVSLRGDEDRILGRMKQKTRYNIRLAIKRGVIVRPCTDLEIFYRLISKTGERDAFGIHSKEYYKRVYELFYPRGMCELFLAEYDQQPLAGLMVFAHGSRAWYFYGGSSNVHRDKMPTYLLQWEAMRWAKSIGCTEYDLWGVPDEEHETLEDEFVDRSDALWGVYRFKRGFGGKLIRTVGSWDRIYIPPVYSLIKMWSSLI